MKNKTWDIKIIPEDKIKKSNIWNQTSGEGDIFRVCYDENSEFYEKIFNTIIGKIDMYQQHEWESLDILEEECKKYCDKHRKSLKPFNKEKD